jgi:hypothetical protein
MVQIRLPPPHGACNENRAKDSEDKTIVGCGSYTRGGTNDKLVSAVISHESPVTGRERMGRRVSYAR